ncbi:hypothetical protein DQG23_39180 [Paenibacillus contaminans]|uniref:Uncharacterized protein n=1 Tax=Paenibacillus contaminans TaxID=450362 RepID=A0A329LSY5_9BACL|nr:hypothetical protein DQG23_39180 [Paenibacillus contaminans]
MNQEAERPSRALFFYCDANYAPFSYFLPKYGRIVRAVYEKYGKDGAASNCHRFAGPASERM